MSNLFEDRQSAYPGRYKATDESGSSYYLTLERADEPTRAGTPLNAATLNKLVVEDQLNVAEIGVEYLTPERWQGKEVYTKLIDCGAFPNASYIQVAHGAAAVNVIRCCGMSSGGGCIPAHYANGDYIEIGANEKNVWIVTTGDQSAYTAYAQIWYTKE